METTNIKTQRVSILIGVILVLILLAGIYYTSQKQDYQNGEIRATFVQKSHLKTLEAKLTSITEQIGSNENKLTENQRKIVEKLDELSDAVKSGQEQNEKLYERTRVVQDNANAGTSEKKAQTGDNLSGPQWEEALSFLHMDSSAICEDIFNAQPGQQYSDKVNDYYKMVDEHDRHLASLNLTTLFKDYDGHSSNYREETYVMWSIVQLPFVKTVCETGFNAGHSTLLWLSVNPNVHVYTFDNAGFPAARPMAEHLMQKYPNRLTVTWGDSTQTLPAFIQNNPSVKCDLMIVDGGHEYEIATSDIKNFQKMVNGPKNILFMDNYPDHRFGNKHARAWEQFKRRGEVLEIFQCHYKNLLQGFTFGRFLV